MNSLKKSTEAVDRRHMMVALTLARRSLGNVWPNPAVGCVIVGADRSVVGRGWMKPGGNQCRGMFLSSEQSAGAALAREHMGLARGLV